MANLWNQVRDARKRRGWTQAVLAERAGLSRTEVSAIETGRVVPATSAALALARALGARVDELFGLSEAGESAQSWAWAPGRERRYWLSESGGRLLRYPVEPTALGLMPQDGESGGPAAGGQRAGRAAPGPRGWAASRTLVIAGCDPSVSLLAHALQGRGIRVLAFTRSSARALGLLRAGVAHVAGVHLGSDGQGNAAAARRALGASHHRIHVARWTEGLALAPGLGHRTIASAVRARLRWVGREEGSGARRCMDQILEGRRVPEGAQYTATDHRGVAEAIRTGWAQAGVCVELAAQEGGLDFLAARDEDYDFCFRAEMREDDRIVALLDVLRSSEFARQMRALPGYDVRRTGDFA